jgi:peptidoglycan/LPS O-acetylase OafA/YrhL
VTADAALLDTTPAQDHDRTFRPDVEGLRAVAVAVVVLYHAGVAGFGGGYVGVDVFFVVSGFVITKLLLGQMEQSGRPRLAEFYGRRARRILPAAGLVGLVAVLAAYKWLGFIQGNETADDARWVAVFFANNHFASEGTNYFQSQLPPSPLQNYWSLAVEEQFYVVYPTALLLLGLLARKVPIRTRVAGLTTPRPTAPPPTSRSRRAHGSWHWEASWRRPRRAGAGCRRWSRPLWPGSA